MKQDKLPGLSYTKSLQKINEKTNRKPVKRYVQTKYCGRCRYWYPIPISGTADGCCSVKQDITVREDTCKDWEVYAGFCVKPSEEVVQQLLVEYADGIAKFKGELQKVAKASGYKMAPNNHTDDDWLRM